MTDQEKLARVQGSIILARQWIRVALDSLAGIECANDFKSPMNETVRRLFIAMNECERAELRRARIVSTRKEDR